MNSLLRLRLKPAGRDVPSSPGRFRRHARIGSLALVLAGVFTAPAAEPPRLQLLTEGLTAPIALSSLPDGSGRLLVADQAGMIHLVSRTGEKAANLFLDLRDRLVKLNQGMDERGITGLAMHPDFGRNRKFYVAYNAPLQPGGPPDWSTTMRVSEFRVSEQDPARGLPGSERILMAIDKPDWGHNSGRIAFGADGFLYITVGDGGGPNDVGVRGHAPEGNGQHLQTLLGKMLRIDVNNGNPYAIPADNPFADGKKALPEIYAYGLRNPWGLSFDRAGGYDPIITDIGQERWEEVNVIVKGGNYGWRLKEGFDGFDLKDTRSAPAHVPATGANGEPLIDPVLVYKTRRSPRDEPDAFGVSATGGYIYRGKALPQLAGKYVFGDWSSSMALGDGCLLVATRPQKPGAAGRWTAGRLALKNSPEGKVGAFLWSLGEDEDGELYVMTNGANLVSGTRGKLYKLVP